MDKCKVHGEEGEIPRKCYETGSKTSNFLIIIDLILRNECIFFCLKFGLKAVRIWNDVKPSFNIKCLIT